MEERLLPVGLGQGFRQNEQEPRQEVQPAVATAAGLLERVLEPAFPAYPTTDVVALPQRFPVGGLLQVLCKDGQVCPTPAALPGEALGSRRVRQVVGLTGTGSSEAPRCHSL